MSGYIYVLFTLIFTVYGQLILKWRLNILSFRLPEGIFFKLTSLLKLFFDPFIFSGFVSAFMASLFWMAAISKLEITKAYPFMSLAPSLVLLFGVIFLDESFTWPKFMGLLLIILGILFTVIF